MEFDMSLLWAVLSIVVPIIASIIVASIAIANHLGKRIDAVNKRIDDMNTRIDDLRSEMVREINALRSEMVRGIDALRSEMNKGADNLNKRIDDLRTDLGKWVEITDADIRELRAPIFAQASGKAAPDGSNFRKQASAVKRAGGG